ncbi:17_t:CDS:2 [Funneliformis caledonium]|uniref:17_t:CDS:1 n=1 Tax=Funneliformis caledonium TaxID=1117310 RepID=A0A9N9BA45_9GLOM|nr:17_t:CDS:2 [Funneliformis caledonium]
MPFNNISVYKAFGYPGVGHGTGDMDNNKEYSCPSKVIILQDFMASQSRNRQDIGRCQASEKELLAFHRMSTEGMLFNNTFISKFNPIDDD